MRPSRSLVLFIAASALVIAACGSSGGSSAASAAAPQVSGAWARSAPNAGQSAAYFTISNPSTAADALLSASSPDAGMVEVHETSTDGSGMTGMHPVERVAIPAGGSVTFKPGSYHLMLMDLHAALSAGGTVELDLVFEHGGKVVVKAEIRNA